MQEAYARKHEEIFHRQATAIAQKDKLKIARHTEQNQKWEINRNRLQDLLTQKRTLQKREEKEVRELLDLEFPDESPPISDDSSVSSLDSQLTSDTSQDEMHFDQGLAAKARRQQARLDKKERKINVSLARKMRRIAFREERMALTAPPVQKF